MSNRTVHIFGRFVHWQRGVTNIILWIHVYVDFLSSCFHAFYLRRVSMFSRLFSCCPTHCPPSPPSLFSVCQFFVRTVSMLFPICHDQLMPTSTLFEIIFLFSLYNYHHLSPLSVMFSSSCRVAKLTHHPLLIGNQDDSGDEMFLPAVYRLVDLLEN